MVCQISEDFRDSKVWGMLGNPFWGKGQALFLPASDHSFQDLGCTDTTLRNSAPAHSSGDCPLQVRPRAREVSAEGSDYG